MIRNRQSCDFERLWPAIRFLYLWVVWTLVSLVCSWLELLEYDLKNIWYQVQILNEKKKKEGIQLIKSSISTESLVMSEFLTISKAPLPNYLPAFCLCQYVLQFIAVLEGIVNKDENCFFFKYRNFGNFVFNFGFVSFVNCITLAHMHYEKTKACPHV